MDYNHQTDRTARYRGYILTHSTPTVGGSGWWRSEGLPGRIFRTLRNAHAAIDGILEASR